MDSKIAKLTAVLDDAEKLLRKHGVNSWANWLAEGIALIRRGDSSGLDHILSGFGGMGSFTDIYICPANHHAIAEHSVTKVNDRLSALSTEIYTLARDLKTEEEQRLRYRDRRISFAEAVEQFRRFLEKQGDNAPILWVRPCDFVTWMGRLLLRPSIETERHAETLFDEAVKRGFGVAFEACARLDHSLCCFVFAPDDKEDAASHFVAPPLTFKVRQNLKTLQEPNPLQWWAARRLASRRDERRILQFFGYELDLRKGTRNV